MVLPMAAPDPGAVAWVLLLKRKTEPPMAGTWPPSHIPQDTARIRFHACGTPTLSTTNPDKSGCLRFTGEARHASGRVTISRITASGRLFRVRATAICDNQQIPRRALPWSHHLLHASPPPDARTFQSRRTFGRRSGRKKESADDNQARGIDARA